MRAALAVICFVMLWSHLHAQTVQNSNPNPRPAGIVSANIAACDPYNPPSCLMPAARTNVIASGTTGAVTATMPAVAGSTNYLCAIDVEASGGTAAVSPFTIMGLLGGPLTTIGPPLISSATGAGVQRIWTPCLPATNPNVPITVSTTADATASSVKVMASGFTSADRGATLTENSILFALGAPQGPGYVGLLQLTSAGPQTTTISNGFCGPTSTVCWPEWSPDSTRIVFQAALPGLGSGIYIMNSNGTGLTRLSAGGSTADSSPSFDPTGQKIVYNITTTGNRPSINIMNADGTGVTAVTTPSVSTYFVEPHWSAQNQIVALSNLGGGQDVYTMNIDGSNQTRLTSTGSSGDPEWSPDGNTIGFSHTPDGVQLNVYTMHKDGTNVVQVTNFVQPQEAAVPSFNYDGSQIAMEWDTGGLIETVTTARTEVWIVNSDGTNPHTTGQPCPNVGCHPKWAWR
jgi:hypothetical protein